MEYQSGAQEEAIDKKLAEAVLGQPAQLPMDLEQKIDAATWGTPRLYSLLDLMPTEAWLILCRECLVVAQKIGRVDWRLQELRVSDMSSVKEVKGLSSSRLVIYGAEPKVGLASVIYSHRQNRSVSQIKYLLELDIKQGQQAEGLKLTGSNATELPSEAQSHYLRELLEPLKKAQASSNRSESGVVWRLLGYLKPYKVQVTFGMASAVLMTLVSLLPAMLTGYIIDKVIKPFQGGRLSIEAAQSTGLLIIGTLVAVYLSRELFAWVRLRTMSVVGEYVARDLRNDVYAHLHKLSLSYFSSKQTGSLISRVGSDTDRLWDFIAFGVVEVTTSLIMLMSLSAVLIFLDWPLGLIVTIPVPFLLYLIFRHGTQMQTLFLRAWRKWSELTDCLSDTIPGIRVVKAFNKGVAETKKFKERNARVVKEFDTIHRKWTSFWPLLMLSIQTIVVSVWYFGLPRVLEHIGAFKGADNAELVGLTPGVFISFILYMGMFVQPIEVIGQMARMINRATSSAYRVFEVLDTKPQIVEKPNAIELKNFKGAIEFRQVSFSYDGVRRVVDSISFNIQPGETIGLVGKSGGGKSTILNLLARFYDVNHGRILVDGHELADLSLESWRGEIGMVLQEPYLFHGSIVDNIRYGHPTATLQQVVEVSKAANCHEFICGLAQGYDTMVGERGHSLSGGERQRISIARAILKDPKVLLLDEATSAVDSETEMLIQKALDKLIEGRTVIAIAHRLSTLKAADRIFVVDQGKIVESGGHIELLKRPNGMYRKLVSLQKAFELS